MDEMVNSVEENEDKEIRPMRCPRCGKRVIFKEDDAFECPDCGELYYDGWLGIYRIKDPE